MRQNRTMRRIAGVFAVTVTITSSFSLVGCGGANGTSQSFQPTASTVEGNRASVPLSIITRVQQLPPFAFDEAAQIIEATAAANPELPKDGDAFREKILDQLKNSTRPTRSSSIFNTTPDERNLIAWQPWSAYLTYWASRKAVDETNRRFAGWGQYQDKADGFRHAYWNVLTSKRVNEEWARWYTTAHESESSGVDKAMDLNNNAIGRRIFRENGFRSEDDLSGYVFYFPSRKVSKESEMNNYSYVVYLK